MKILDSRPRVVEGRLLVEPVRIPRRDPRSRRRVSRGAEKPGGGPVVRVAPPPRFHPAAAEGRSGCAGIDAAASAESPPTRGSPFAPSDEKQSTPLSPTERVCDGSTSAGRRVRGPRACLAAFGLQPPAHVGLACPGGSRGAGPAGLTSLPSRARHAGGQNRHQLLPGRSASPRPRRGPCPSLSGHSAGREAGERDHPSSPGMDMRERAPGLELGGGSFSSAEPPLTRSLHAPPPSLRRHVPGRFSDSRSRAPVPAPAQRAGPNYKSQQAPRREGRSGRRGSAQRLRSEAAPACEYHTPGTDRGEAEASEALKHPREPEGRRME